MREGLTTLLARVSDFEIVAAGSRADQALLQTAKPQVVLLDLGLQKDNSLQVTQVIRETMPDTRVVLMDLLPVHEDIAAFVNAGVSGFVMKDASLDDLVGTIRAVAAGTNVLPPEMTQSLFSQIARVAVESGRTRTLANVRMTPRERQVVLHIADGLSNKEIAAALHIATHTVKSHVRNIMEKLTLHTRLQIAAYAHQAERTSGDPATTS